MCGIFAISQSKVLKNNIKFNVFNDLKHRGPDSNGYKLLMIIKLDYFIQDLKL